MDVFVGVLGLVAIGWLVSRWLRGTDTPVTEVRPASPPDRTPVSSAPPSPAHTASDRLDGSISGILIGHAVANGHEGFPGDPLPSGHLGSPANLAFWGSMFDEDEDEEDEL